MLIKILTSIIILFAFSSCNVLFSPTVNLPPNPMLKEEVSLTAGGGAFPFFGFGSDIRFATEAEAGYGFSDNFALRLKGWNDFGFLSDEATLWGTSTSAIIMINRRGSDFRLAIIPVAGFAADGSEITAGGFELHLGMWAPDYYFIKPRFSIGTIYGTRKLGEAEWGIGGSANLALSADITDYLYVNLESYIISMYRNDNDKMYGFAGMVLGLGFYF